MARADWRTDLTLQRNLFGTTYYVLVGFHGVHVDGGRVGHADRVVSGLRRQATQRGVALVSWYWHFVDGVWVVVFTVVYLVGR